MLVIDADTHVDETESTWEYMREEELQFKPTTGYPSSRIRARPSSRYWLIDGHRQIRFIRDDKKDAYHGRNPGASGRVRAAARDGRARDQRASDLSHAVYHGGNDTAGSLGCTQT